MRTLLVALSFLLPFQSLFSQNRTIGLTKYSENHQKGYYLFTPLASKSTYLINECGELVNSWHSNYTSGITQLFAPDGSMYRCGMMPPPRFGPGSGGIIEKFDWAGNVTWKFVLSDTNYCLHHDIQLMPNGNILAIAWENHTMADAQQNGRDPGIPGLHLWSEIILEIKPLPKDSFEIVWQWRPWDHLVQNFDNTKPNYGKVEDHPELYNLNFVGDNPMDWFHFNSVDYNAELDQIVLSSNSWDEIYIVDHSTTTSQAAGHTGGRYGKGGDILYRWGNPQAYNRGDDDDRKLFKQHHAHWIPDGFANAGKILVFNNGFNREGPKFSSIDIIDPPVSAPGVYTLDDDDPFGPEDETTVYRSETETDFYAQNLSAVQSLPDSSIFVTSGPQGRFFEVDHRGIITWEYTNPVIVTGPLAQGTTPGFLQNNVFRCVYYPTNFSGFAGKAMTGKGELEKDPLLPGLCTTAGVESDKRKLPVSVQLFPNPATSELQIRGVDAVAARILDSKGRCVLQTTGTNTIDISSLPSGLYLVSLESGNGRFQLPFIKE
jgi:hypothetical protein